ncbi:MAG: CARDB domain-containing protein [Myxococcota bacterium]|nr:CARDB domain-containing protein [Myxococcota bacterium]
MQTFNCYRSSLFSGVLGQLSAPQSLLAAYWDDLSFESTGSNATKIRFETRGTAPNREFIVDWQKVVHHQAFPGEVRGYTSFMAKLYEPHSIIELHFGDSVASVDTPSWAGQIGIENADGQKIFRPIHCDGRQQGCDWESLEGLRNKVIIFGDFDGPELIAQFSGPTGGRTAENVTAQLTVSNVGHQSTNEPFDARIYLEETTSTTVSKTLLAIHNFDALDTTQSATASIAFSLPVLTSSASYQLIAHIDESKAVREGATQNNQVYSATAFSTGENFSVDSLQAGLNQITGELHVAADLINSGPRIDNVEIRIYSSQDTTLDSADTIIMSERVSIPAVKRTKFERRLSNVTGVTNTYLFIEVDPESETQDILRSDNFSLNGPIQAQPDLSITIEKSDAVTVGEFTEFEISLGNNGAYVAAVDWEIYYSKDQILDSSDFLIASGRQDLGLSRESRLASSVSVPMIPGGYYNVLSVVDPGNYISENNETNNTQPSLQKTEVTGVDLVVSLNSRQSAFYLNQETLFDFTVTNSQAAISPETRINFYLSDNRLISSTDVLIGTTTIASLGENSQIQGTFRWTPTSNGLLGLKHLGLVVDPANEIVETNEQNNKFATPQPIPILPEAPDFRVTYLDAYETTGTGDTLDIAFEVQNNGVIESVAPVALYLSSSSTFTPSSATLLFEDIVPLAANTRQVRSTRIVVPNNIPAGKYFLTLICDPNQRVNELDETNNSRTLGEPIHVDRSSIRIENISLPKGVLGYNYLATLIVSGSSDPVIWSINGTLPSGISFDPVTATLQGTPQNFGTFELLAQASSTSWTVNKQLFLKISETGQNLIITTPGLPVGQVSYQYDYLLTAHGGSGLITWSTEDALPEGLTLSKSGRISGEPTNRANQSIVVTAQDEIGDSIRKELKIRVVDGDNKLRFSYLPNPTFYLAQNVSIRIESSNAVLPTKLSILEGSLPPGINLEGQYLRGSARSLGTYSAVLQIADSEGQTSKAAIRIEVVPSGSFKIGPSKLPFFYLGERLEEQTEFQLANETNPADAPTFEVIQGRLPAGVRLVPQGLFEGTPTESGRFDFIVQGVTVSGQLGQQAFTLLILDSEMQTSSEACSCRSSSVSSRYGSWTIIGLLGLLFLRRKQKSPAS